MHARIWICVAIAAAAAMAACRGFKVAQYPTNEALYAAGRREYERERWGNAIAAFEKLTNDLPVRDSLLPRAYWYLASAHERNGEHLLAAQSYNRLAESFPEDTLADRSLLAAGRSYRSLWRKPSLDASYGETALIPLNALIGLYPESVYADSARAEMADLEQWFATKDYLTGMFYFRRKAYDSANIYFTGILERWPHVPRARDALLRLAESYQAISYREQFAETCERLRRSYPGDQDTSRICGAVPTNDAAVATPRPAPPA